MNDGPWRRYVSLFTTKPIDIDASTLVADLEVAFKAGGLPEPYNTETNAPDNKNGAPIVKVETSDGRNGVWIGNHLIFMPVGDDDDAVEKMLNVIRSSQLAALGAHSYTLNSTCFSSVSEEQARLSKNKEVTDLLTNPKAQEFSKNVTKQLTDTLTAKDIITISRSANSGLTVEMSIAIDSTETKSGQSIGDLLAQVDFNALKAHEDEIRQRAGGILE